MVYCKVFWEDRWSDWIDLRLLIEGILYEEIPFDILRFERDLPEVDEIEKFFKFYSKHADKPSKKHDDIVKT